MVGCGSNEESTTCPDEMNRDTYSSQANLVNSQNMGPDLVVVKSKLKFGRRLNSDSSDILGSLESDMNHIDTRTVWQLNKIKESHGMNPRPAQRLHRRLHDMGGL